MVSSLGLKAAAALLSFINSKLVASLPCSLHSWPLTTIALGSNTLEEKLLTTEQDNCCLEKVYGAWRSRCDSGKPAIDMGKKINCALADWILINSEFYIFACCVFFKVLHMSVQ